MDQFRRFYDALVDMADEGPFEHLTLTGGDPQAWRHLIPALQYHGVAWFDLQLTTALMRPLSDEEARLYREKVKTIRLSLDAATPEVMALTRGVSVDPAEIADRAGQLDHPDLRVLCTVDPWNIGQIGQIIRLSAKAGASRLSFVPVFDVDFGQEFWDKYYTARSEYRDYSWCDPDWNLPQSSKARCWAARMSFHVKANGDLYPCCTVGGEALETRPGFKIGNVHEADLPTLWKVSEEFTDCYRPYSEEDGGTCNGMCLPKQRRLNEEAEVCRVSRLAFP